MSSGWCGFKPDMDNALKEGSCCEDNPLCMPLATIGCDDASDRAAFYNQVFDGLCDDG